MRSTSVTAPTTRFDGCRAGTRAVQLPDNGFNSYFLTVFGRPEASSACECERSSEANLAQSLHLLNSPEVQARCRRATAAPRRWPATRTARTKRRFASCTCWLSRARRTPEEVAVAAGPPGKAKNEADPQAAYEDILWALINTKQFLFNH